MTAVVTASGSEPLSSLRPSSKLAGEFAAIYSSMWLPLSKMMAPDRIEDREAAGAIGDDLVDIAVIVGVAAQAGQVGDVQPAEPALVFSAAALGKAVVSRT